MGGEVDLLGHGGFLVVLVVGFHMAGDGKRRLIEV
jgi:hypothetical protein